MGRDPSTSAVTMEPDACSGRSDKKSSDGFATSAKPQSPFEHADFAHRTEAILDRAQNSVCMAAFAFKIEDCIHHVLQDFWACQSPVLCHVAHDEARGGAFLRGFKHSAPHLANLGHTTGLCLEGSAVKRIGLNPTRQRLCLRPPFSRRWFQARFPPGQETSCPQFQAALHGSFNCSEDSSPETYSTLCPEEAMLASACMSRVLLPMPGSPQRG